MEMSKLKIVFVHDHRFIPVRDRVYSQGQYPASVWDRYLGVFDSITVIGRQGRMAPDQSVERLALSSHPRVRFVLAPDLSSVLFWRAARREAARIIDAALEEADGVIARLPSELGYLAIGLAKRQGKPWAVELVGCAWDGLWNYGSILAKLYAPVRYYKTRRAVAEAPFVLYVTEQFLQGRYPNHIGVTVACPNVEIEEPRQDVLKRRLARIRNVEGRPIVFGLIGTLRGRFKGIQTVLAALRYVREEVPGVVFRVLGPGDVTRWQREAEKLGVADLVRFDGLLPPGASVMAWLDSVDVYLQPSLKEGLPRALVEAMSRGCPAIGSNCGGIPELLDSDSLINPGDYRALARLMVRAATDLTWRAAAAERNWRVAQRYSREVLNARRSSFWKRFGEYILKGGG